MGYKRLEAKLDKVIESQNGMNTILTKQSVVLEEHVKRTNLLEAEIKPIKQQSDMIKGALKLISAVGLGALIKALYG